MKYHHLQNNVKTKVIFIGDNYGRLVADSTVLHFVSMNKPLKLHGHIWSLRLCIGSEEYFWFLPQWQLSAAGTESEIYVWNNDTGGKVCSFGCSGKVFSLIKPRQECLPWSNSPRQWSCLTLYLFSQACPYCLFVWLIIFLVILSPPPRALASISNIHYIPSVCLLVWYPESSQMDFFTNICTKAGHEPRNHWWASDSNWAKVSCMSILTKGLQ